MDNSIIQDHEKVFVIRDTLNGMPLWGQIEWVDCFTGTCFASLVWGRWPIKSVLSLPTTSSPHRAVQRCKRFDACSGRSDDAGILSGSMKWEGGTALCRTSWLSPSVEVVLSAIAQSILLTQGHPGVTLLNPRLRSRHRGYVYPHCGDAFGVRHRGSVSFNLNNFEQHDL